MNRWIDYEVQRGFTDWADLCDKHNAEVASLEAERDEFQRRLNRLCFAIKDDAESACYCEFDRYETRTLHCEHCERAERIIAIAEGRE